jgi:hypothetical protein
MILKLVIGKYKSFVPLAFLFAVHALEVVDIKKLDWLR